MKMTCPCCHGSGSVPDLQLSQNFRLSEFVRSTTAEKLSIPNVPTSSQVDALRRLCVELLQPLRDRFGPIRVTSGYRTPVVNAAVGGVANSAHLTGDAADIFPVRASLDEVMAFLDESDLVWDQAIDEGTHIHIARAAAGVPRRQLLVKRDGAFTAWTRQVA